MEETVVKSHLPYMCNLVCVSLYKSGQKALGVPTEVKLSIQKQ